MNSTYYQQHPANGPRADGTQQVAQYRRNSQQDHNQYGGHYQEPPRRRSSDNNHYHERPTHPRRRDERNPLMTIWRETYEVWDGVLEAVGKAWFKMGGK